LKIIFIGAPGSGKGTQSREFIDKYGYVQLSTGDLLRGAISQGSDLGVLAKNYMDQGKLVPDEIMIGLVKNYLTTESEKSVILDGFPRTIAQAESLDLMLKSNADRIDKVIYFKINPQILVERLTGRRTCAKCSEIYHIKTKPSKASGVCDKCGGQVVQRPDDKEDVIVERLAQFEKNTGPTIEYYRTKKALFEIDGTQEPSIVFEEIQKSLGLLN
jgi:adenylate kinase